jgi:cyclic di-GMP phosphodiesterase
MGELIRRLTALRVERVTIARGVTIDELKTFVAKFEELEARGHNAAAALGSQQTGGAAQKDAAAELDSASIRVGKVTVDERAPDEGTDSATIRRMYAEAVSVATAVWESARSDEHPDPSAAQTMIDGLAQAVLQNRSAVLALTALKEYDNYTFTHMVNVSILTMAQARGLGIDGPLLREFGMAALMHDIGKVKTPIEILNKPDKLTDEEFVVMKQHPVDGAEILRSTPDIPSLAPVVAFEHHLRIDGTGYPAGISRPQLNLATMLCSIADVYDAMRSQRRYQQAFPSERIIAVLQRNDGTQFDPHLVRRFVQLLGIYPVGNLVKLNSGEVAIVLQVHAPDPYRPKVKILFGADEKRLEVPHDVNLWEMETAPDRASSVIAPLNPADYHIDPLSFI